jgi:hypothetical protein
MNFKFTPLKSGIIAIFLIISYFITGFTSYYGIKFDFGLLSFVLAIPFFIIWSLFQKNPKQK